MIGSYQQWAKSIGDCSPGLFTPQTSNSKSEALIGASASAWSMLK